jgi:uncharacterized protein YlaI
MSTRKHGSRLNGRQIECYFCQKLGNHGMIDLKNNPIHVCKECQDLIEIADAAYDAEPDNFKDS